MLQNDLRCRTMRDRVGRWTPVGECELASAREERVKCKSGFERIPYEFGHVDHEFGRVVGRAHLAR